MADTIRELIIQEFIARAAVIRTAGSPPLYATDIGATVLRARPKVAPAELPCTVIWPQPEEAENAHGMVQHWMPIRVEGLALFEAENPSLVAERILGDLVKCFTSPAWDRRRPVAGSPVIYLSPYAESIIYQGGGTDEYPEDGAVSVASSAHFRITYWTVAGDPCSQ